MVLYNTVAKYFLAAYKETKNLIERGRGWEFVSC